MKSYIPLTLWVLWALLCNLPSLAYFLSQWLAMPILCFFCILSPYMAADGLVPGTAITCCNRGDNYNDMHACQVLLLTIVALNFLGDIQMYLHFLWSITTEITQVVEILPCERQGPGYPALSLPWLLMILRYRASAAMILPSCPRIFWFQHLKG